MGKSEYPTEVHLGKAALYLLVVAVILLVTGVATELYFLATFGLICLVFSVFVGVRHLRLMARMRR